MLLEQLQLFVNQKVVSFGPLIETHLAILSKVQFKKKERNMMISLKK
jgi:hypothetical protein